MGTIQLSDWVILNVGCSNLTAIRGMDCSSNYWYRYIICTIFFISRTIKFEENHIFLLEKKFLVVQIRVFRCINNLKSLFVLSIDQNLLWISEQNFLFFFWRTTCTCYFLIDLKRNLSPLSVCQQRKCWIPFNITYFEIICLIRIICVKIFICLVFYYANFV